MAGLPLRRRNGFSPRSLDVRPCLNDPLSPDARPQWCCAVETCRPTGTALVSLQFEDHSVHFEHDEEADGGFDEPSPRRRCHARRDEAESFNCRRCGRPVPPQPYGSHHRNHCPHCLWSLHVDEAVGDRRCACRGKMEPIAVWVRDDGEWALIHRCTSCGTLRSNRIAADDNPWAMMSVAARALANPPFPVD